MFTILTIILIIILFILFYFLLKRCVIPKNSIYEHQYLIPNLEQEVRLESIITHQIKKLNENEHNIINNKLNLEGKQLHQSIDNGDCFFESIAICLNNLGIKDKNNNKYTAKTIRMIERDYIDISYNDEDFKEYINNYYISGRKILKEFPTPLEKEQISIKTDFLTYIGFNAEDINRCNEIIISPIWGEPKRDLYILCKQLNIDVRIIYSENNIFSDFIYCFENNKFCEKEFIKEQYKDRIIIELASDGKHFVPIIKI